MSALDYQTWLQFHDDNGVPREIAWYPVQNYQVDYGKGKPIIKNHRGYLVRNADVALTKV